MGIFSKKNNTNITQTGLGDAQFNDLSTGQGSILDQTQANFDALTQAAADAEANFLAASAARDAATAAAASAASGANATAASNYSTLTGAVDTGFTGVNDRFNTTDATLKGIGDANTALSTNLLGADGAGGQIGAINTGVADLGTNMATGFTDLESANSTRAETTDGLVSTGFTDLTALNNANTETSMADLETKYKSLTDNVDATRTGLTTLGQTNQAANLEQQQLILKALESAGLQRTNYYTTLKADTDDIITRVGNFSSDFGNYTDTYNDNATLANQQRGQIRSAQTANTGDLMVGIAGNRSATESVGGNVQAGIMASNAGLRTLGGDLAAGTSGTTQDFASVAQLISSGFQTNDAETNSMKNEFVGRLDTMRNVLSDADANIDAGFRENYGQMVNSFDSQGSLIQQTALANGDYITRAIDDSGNLLLSQFNQAGSRTSQSMLNLNEMMARMDQMGYIPGSNQNMAIPSGSSVTPANVYSGQSVPYASTVG